MYFLTRSWNSATSGQFFFGETIRRSLKLQINIDQLYMRRTKTTGRKKENIYIYTHVGYNQKNCNKFLRPQLQLINDSWGCPLYKSCVLLHSLTDESFHNIYSPFEDPSEQNVRCFAYFSNLLSFTALTFFYRREKYGNKIDRSWELPKYLKIIENEGNFNYVLTAFPRLKRTPLKRAGGSRERYRHDLSPDPPFFAL